MAYSDSHINLLIILALMQMHKLNTSTHREIKKTEFILLITVINETDWCVNMNQIQMLIRDKMDLIDCNLIALLDIIQFKLDEHFC